MTNCFTLGKFNDITIWRNQTGSLGELILKRITAEFCYLGLAIAGTIEMIFKAFLSLGGIQCTDDWGYLMSNDAALSCQVAVCSIAHLITNIFADNLSQIPLVVMSDMQEVLPLTTVATAAEPHARALLQAL